MECFPDLPLDVARRLLEEAAWSDRPSTARNLTLVSKDVRQWIDPILYHTVTLDTPAKVHAFAATVISRNDPEFFYQTVKVLTIGSLEGGQDFSEETIDITDSMTVILSSCSGIQRLAFWMAATVQMPLDLLCKYSQPTHVSLGAGNIIAASSHLRVTMFSPLMTHLHLDFASLDLLDFFNSPVIKLWPEIFNMSPGLTHLLLSGRAFETLKPHDFSRAVIHILLVLPHTITSFIISVISLRVSADNALPVQLKTLLADPRVVFILPPVHPLLAIKYLQPHEKNRDGCVNWGSPGDIDDGQFSVDILRSVFG